MIGSVRVVSAAEEMHVTLKVVLTALRSSLPGFRGLLVIGLQCGQRFGIVGKSVRHLNQLVLGSSSYLWKTDTMRFCSNYVGVRGIGFPVRLPGGRKCRLGSR